MVGQQISQSFSNRASLAGAFIALSQSELSLGRTVSFLQEGFRVRAEQEPLVQAPVLCYQSPGLTACLCSDYQTQTCWWKASRFRLVPANLGVTEDTPETWHRNSHGQMLEEEEREHPSWGWGGKEHQSGKPAPQAD